ncbi:MAG: glutamyl-tRNA reductase [Gammaproteobacteria bacterium]|nr:glutamyl-tRNA reductase [Gammaproteobacteria bacterium]
MPLIAIGLNHKTAPVHIRERVAFAADQLPDILRSFTAESQLSEAAILSTCNRTELLCYGNDIDSQRIIDWFSTFHRLPGDEVNPYLYIYPERDAVRHMLRVACGLDSMILGEPQILGQMKDAYATAIEAGTVHKMLGRLFQHTFLVAKQVRTDTAIGESSVSVAFATVSLAKQIFSTLNDRTALLIGAGETIELTARHLREHGIRTMIIANRTLARAEALVQEFSGMAITLSEIPDHLHQADIVISSTASPLPILGKGAVERAIRQRKHRPILMVDIAVPRDIEPEVAELEDVYLYSVDDLHDIIQEGLNSRQQAAVQAEEIIDVQVEHFMGWLRSLDAVTTIRLYREQSQAICDAELDKALQQLARGENAEQVMAQLARSLTNKLIHTPSAQLRRAGFDGRSELLRAARELFNIDDLPDN